ncbi:hypothetical protein [Paenibacillus ehimensis]|uniref:hypothetical protein n=1 Tax=Paenibacillus ehimensis TaxID=79264 RepID=UPI000FD86854|nr:hypothetical protein [Paenibacillus ehimensis]MEC0208512.1 hypothetical protein [Paenibacillus ehimensis]
MEISTAAASNRMLFFIVGLYQLFDLPRVPVYVKADVASEHTVRAVIDKLVGASPFEGRSSGDAFCGSRNAWF